MWWVEPRQYIHHDVVEGDVWHTSPQMLNLRYWQTYRMEFLAFEALVDLLTPFLRPIAATFVRPPRFGKEASKVCFVPIGSWCELC